MARYEVTGPDGARYEVTAPDSMSQPDVLSRFRREIGTAAAPSPSPSPGVGATAIDIANQAASGFYRGLDNLINLPWDLLVRAPASLAGRDVPRGRYFTRIPEAIGVGGPETTAGRYAGAVGEAAGASALPSAALFREASRLPAVAGSVPSLREAFLRPIASRPGTAAAIDVTAAGGAGAASEAAREGGGGPIAQTLAGMAGGVALPVVGTMAARDIMRGGSALANRFGIRASADGGMTATPEGRRRASRLMIDQALRAGVSIEDVDNLLAQVQRARTLHSSGRAQDVVTLADLVPAWQRLAGSAARQYPEAAADISRFLQARQTGITPSGTSARALAQRGLPTREEFAPPMTGAQAERAFGSRFDTPRRSEVPMGQRARVIDDMRRTLRIEDSDFHGHARNPMRTEQQILQAARDEAQPLYRSAYKAAEGVDLRPTIRPIMERWAARSNDEPQPVGRAIQSAMRLFFGPGGRNAQMVSSLERFDKAKQFLDGQIERLFTSLEGRNRYLGGVLTEFKNELLAAIDSLGSVGSAYSRARAAFSDRMTARDILTRFRDAWREDSDVGVDAFAALTSTAQRKLARLGLLWGFERQTAGTAGTRDVTRVFDTPRVQELITEIAPRSRRPGAEFADRPQRFGRLLDFERSMRTTRDVVLGGSQTAKNIQDDLALVSMEAVQNVQGFMGMFRGSTSLWDFGQTILERIIDRSFGISADAAEALARMLFTANPMERAQILRELAANMPRDRMARFNELLQQVQQPFTPAATASLPAAAGALAQSEGQ